jgi:acetyl-CoA carboxylase biotin carboxyl carrier protein
MEQPRSPDVRTIRYLVRLMHRYDLTAIDVTEGATQIRLRRRRDPVASGLAAPGSALAPAPGAGHGHGPGATGTALGGERSPGEINRPNGESIESPMVGTYYSSSAPDAAPFVTLGSQVRPDTIVCVIEAMKVFTDIPAGIAGTITEILVKNGQSVEYGQPLFRVDPA